MHAQKVSKLTQMCQLLCQRRIPIDKRSCWLCWLPGALSETTQNIFCCQLSGARNASACQSYPLRPKMGSQPVCFTEANGYY